jgi:flagellar biosynthesis protein FliR
MLFGLVGPVIVQEQRGIRDAFRRTLALSRKALLPIGILVAVPTALEVLVHEIALGAIHDQGPGARILVEWLLATVIRGAVGLLTVALAVELMARTPEAAPGTPA